MRVIQLTKGQHTVVESCVYEWASKVNWCALRSRNGFYAGRNVSRRQGGGTILLHREILKAPLGVEVDHIDGDGLNNLIENLRFCSHAQNIQNSPKKCNNTSGHKGVAFSRAAGRWQAQITVRGRQMYLGLFDTAIDAAVAYDNAATELHGEFARLNFPVEGAS